MVSKCNQILWTDFVLIRCPTTGTFLACPLVSRSPLLPLEEATNEVVVLARHAGLKEASGGNGRRGRGDRGIALGEGGELVATGGEVCVEVCSTPRESGGVEGCKLAPPSRPNQSRRTRQHDRPRDGGRGSGGRKVNQIFQRESAVEIVKGRLRFLCLRSHPFDL